MSPNTVNDVPGLYRASPSRLGFDRTLMPRLRLCLCPTGTPDNSPPIHRWVGEQQTPQSPGGAKDIPHASFVGPSSLSRPVGNLLRPFRDSPCYRVSYPTV